MCLAVGDCRASCIAGLCVNKFSICDVDESRLAARTFFPCEEICSPVLFVPSCFRQILFSYREHTSLPLVCRKCGDGFKTQRELTTHRQTEHLSSSRYQCSECGAKFDRQPHLEDHVRLKHSGEASFAFLPLLLFEWCACVLTPAPMLTSDLPEADCRSSCLQKSARSPAPSVPRGSQRVALSGRTTKTCTAR